MSMYLWSMLAGSVLVFALYGLRCAKAVRLPVLRQRAWETALLSFVFSVLFGTVLARVGYAVLMQELDFEYDGIEALTLLLEFEINVVSFFCGAAGVCLGVLLANRITRKDAALAGMDAFAPFGAVLAAVFRLGELFFGSYGAGGELPEGSPFAFFPFALRIPVQGSSDYWAWAVCVLSAVFALLWAGFAFLRLRGSSRPGYVFSGAASLRYSPCSGPAGLGSEVGQEPAIPPPLGADGRPAPGYRSPGWRGICDRRKALRPACLCLLHDHVRGPHRRRLGRRGRRKALERGGRPVNQFSSMLYLSGGF